MTRSHHIGVMIALMLEEDFEVSRLHVAKRAVRAFHHFVLQQYEQSWPTAYQPLAPHPYRWQTWLMLER